MVCHEDSADTTSLQSQSLPSGVDVDAIAGLPAATMSTTIRVARVSCSSLVVLFFTSYGTQMEDLPGMQACNLQNLPENYSMKFCSWGQI